MKYELDNLREKARSIAQAKLLQPMTEEAAEDICRFLHEVNLAIGEAIELESVNKQIEAFASQEPNVPLTPAPVKYNNLYEVMGFWSRVDGGRRIDLTIKENGRAWFSDYEISSLSPPNENSDFGGRAQLTIEEDKQYLNFSGRKIEILSLNLQNPSMCIRLDQNLTRICLNLFTPVVSPTWPCQGAI